MKRKVHLKGRLKRYVQWPILMSILLLVMNLCMYPISVKAGVVMSVFVLVYIVIVTVLYVQNRAQIYGGAGVLRDPVRADTEKALEGAGDSLRIAG